MTNPPQTWGLQPKTSTTITTATKPLPKSVNPNSAFFAESSDSSDDEDLSAKSVVNRQLSSLHTNKIAVKTDGGVDDYNDYDAHFDVLSSQRASAAGASKAEETRKRKDDQPKYIHSLLATARQRKDLNDSRYDKKMSSVGKPEADVDPNDIRSVNEEVFVTKGYKDKVEERNKRMKVDDVEEVVKDEGMRGFYKGLGMGTNQSILTGRGAEEESKSRWGEDSSLSKADAILENASFEKVKMKDKVNDEEEKKRKEEGIEFEKERIRVLKEAHNVRIREAMKRFEDRREMKGGATVKTR